MRVKLRKKRRNFVLFKLLFILFLFAISLYFFVTFILKNLVIDLDNEKIISMILNTNNNDLNLDNINNASFVFSYAFGLDMPKEEYVLKESTSSEVLMDPTIYIYNAHPTEKYSYKSYEAFNINPTTVTAAYILSEYLKELDVYSIVEKGNVVDILNTYSWSYSKSYDAARILMESTTKEYKTLNYFIDIHRDSASHEITTTIVNDKPCARFMFVVGLDNENYEANLELSNKINEELLKIHPQFTRGVLEKTGTGVNGVYNQDFHPNTILIEVGGQYNSIEEVNCALAHLAESIKKVINNG